MMKWTHKKHLFNPAEHQFGNGKMLFAQSPQTLVFDDFVRIYFSTREIDETNGKYISHIAFVDYDKSFSRIIRFSDKQVIALGGLGCFDEHGIFPINPLKLEDKILAYTCGWSRRKSVSVETGIGLAFSHDNGATFEKYGTGPIVSASLDEPVLVGDAFVQHINGQFHMWYIFGKKWISPTDTEPEARIYKIGHAVSLDGIDWKKEEGNQIIPDVLNEDECQALPTVVYHDNAYHMYFCYREATDFRKNPGRGYKLGYAFSADLQHWERNDASGKIQAEHGGWDSEMMCYPHLFQVDEKIYLLYNGNEFGKYGFGIAELEQ